MTCPQALLSCVPCPHSPPDPFTVFMPCSSFPTSGLSPKQLSQSRILAVPYYAPLAIPFPNRAMHESINPFPSFGDTLHHPSATNVAISALSLTSALRNDPAKEWRSWAHWLHTLNSCRSGQSINQSIKKRIAFPSLKLLKNRTHLYLFIWRDQYWGQEDRQNRQVNWVIF